MKDMWPDNRRWLVHGLFLAGWAGILSGCSSDSASRYVSPRITGRVLDIESRQPINNVEVRRLASDENPRPTNVPAGGQLLDRPSGVHTGADGRFVVNSLRIFSPIGVTGWYSVTLAFTRGGYQSVLQTYTLTDSTNTPSGEPSIDAGEVLLSKKAK